MNFKKTCKSIVSFVLGTGMMFSGLAFNNKSNAFFTEEFYAENLKKYENDRIMTEILTLLRKVQDNSEALRGNVPAEIISEARENIVETQTELNEALAEWYKILENIKKLKTECAKEQIAVVDLLKKLKQAHTEIEHATAELINQAYAKTETADRELPPIDRGESPVNDNITILEANVKLTISKLRMAAVGRQVERRGEIFFGHRAEISKWQSALTGLKRSIAEPSKRLLLYLAALSLSDSEVPLNPCLDSLEKIIVPTTFLFKSADVLLELFHKACELLFGAKTFNSIVSSKSTEHQ